MLSHITNYLAEWPYIFSMAIAAYLSFEYWRFPDLTIESSFTAGMVATYFFTSDNKNLLLCIIVILLPFLYSVCTWLLTLLNLPSLFASLLIVLSTFSVNFKINGNQTEQSGFLGDSLSIKNFSINSVETGYLISLIIVAISIYLICQLSQSNFGMNMYLSRKARDPIVAKTFGRYSKFYLLLSMFIYNGIAYLGGVGYSLSNDSSSVSFLGAITPGLSCMFIVKSIKDYASAPSSKKRKEPQIFHYFLSHSDSLGFISMTLLGFSCLMTLVRFHFREFIQGQIGLLNASTALGTFLISILIIATMKISGKQSRSNNEEY